MEQSQIKERKIKLIKLIMLCNLVKTLKMKKENTLSIRDAFEIESENIYWVYQFLFVSSAPIPLEKVE